MALAQWGQQCLELAATVTGLAHQCQQFSSEAIRSFIEDSERMRTRHLTEIIQQREAEPKWQQHAAEEQLQQGRQAYETFRAIRQQIEQWQQQDRTVSARVEKSFEEVVQARESGNKQQESNLWQVYQEQNRYLQQLDQQGQELLQQLASQAEIIRQIAPDFLPTARELSFSEIAALAIQNEALISITVTSRGTLVIIITKDTADFIADRNIFFLQDFTSEHLTNLLARQENGHLRGWLVALFEGNQNMREQELAKLCPLLYREIFARIDPVLNENGINKIVFLPHGSLVLLPLHLMQGNGNGKSSKTDSDTQSKGETNDERDSNSQNKPRNILPRDIRKEYYQSDSVSPKSPPKNDYLIDRYQILYALSFKMPEICRNRRDRKAEKIAGVANPTGDLLFADLEAADIGHRHPNATVLHRHQATLQATLQLLKLPGVLHFACHGLFNMQYPLKSFLALAPDQSSSSIPSKPPKKKAGRDIAGFAGWQPDQVPTRGYLLRGEEKISYEPLTLEKILAQTNLAHTGLVTLSACQVGLSDWKHAGEAVSIPAAFLCAGSASVLAGLWSVDDLATCMLMQQFYQNINNGLDRVKSLQNAQHYIRNLTAGELCNYLQQYLTQPEHLQQWLQPCREQDLSPLDRIRIHFHQYSNQPPDSKPFSHPWYWGAFYISGAEK